MAAIIPESMNIEFIESGNVLLPADAPWLSDLLAECQAFPTGAHDDQLDPMFDAIDAVQRRAAPVRVVQAAVAIPMVNHYARR